MHLIRQLINRLKSKNKSYHSKETTTLKSELYFEAAEAIVKTILSLIFNRVLS